MKTKAVYIVIEFTDVDYHGRYKEIIDVYSNKEDAIEAIELLQVENYDGDIDYHYEKFIVK